MSKKTYKNVRLSLLTSGFTLVSSTDTTAVLPPEFSSFTVKTHSGQSTDVDKPIGTVSGDLLLACIGWEYSSKTPVPPSGWTLVQSFTGSGKSAAIYYKVATGSEPSTYTWGLSSSGDSFIVHIARYLNIDNDNPINASAKTQGNSTTAVAPSVTTNVNGCIIVRFCSSSFNEHNPELTSTPATQRDIESIADWSSQGFSDSTQESAGATGTANFAIFSNFTTHATFTIALQPAS